MSLQVVSGKETLIMLSNLPKGYEAVPFFLFLLQILEIRVEKTQTPYTFVCVPVFVRLQNAN